MTMPLWLFIWLVVTYGMLMTLFFISIIERIVDLVKSSKKEKENENNKISE